MNSYTSLRNLFGSLADNDGSVNLTLGDQLINIGHRKVLKAVPRLREKVGTLSTTASTQNIELFHDYLQLMGSPKVTISATIYVPKEAPSRSFWDQLNQSVVSSNITEYYFIDDNQIYLWPIPSSSTSNAVSVPYKKRIKELSVADYITGTASVTNGSATVTGSGTTFTKKMIGRYIRITDGNATATTGDGEWYEILSFTSATVITLTKIYDGETAAGAAFTIGQMTLIPEDYDELPVWYALWQYFLKQDTSKATAYKQAFDEGVKELKATFGNKTDNPVVDDGMDKELINPNLTISL